MTQQKSWAMSAVVLGTYLCAVCFAGDAAVGSRPPPARPTALRPQPATRPVVTFPVMATVADLAAE